jgi:hypothetical protein
MVDYLDRLKRVQYEGRENYIIRYCRIYKIVRQLNYGGADKTDTVTPPPFED